MFYVGSPVSGIYPPLEEDSRAHSFLCLLPGRHSFGDGGRL